MHWNPIELMKNVEIYEQFTEVSNIFSRKMLEKEN